MGLGARFQFLAVLGIGASIGMLTAACTTAPESDFHPADHGVSSYVGNAENAGDAALLAGVVRIHNDCLMIEPEWDPKQLVIPLFPDGALSLVDDHIVYTPAVGHPVLLEDGAKVRLGGGGGGQMETITSGDGKQSPITPGKGCPAKGYFLVASGKAG